MAADAANADLMGDGDGGGNDGAGGDTGGGGDAGGKPGDGGGAGSGGDTGGADDLLGDDPPKEGEKKVEPEKKADAKPADYAIEVPKELEAFADKEALESFGKLAKEQGLTKPQADAIAKQAIERAKAHNEAITKKVADASKAWYDEIKNDEKIGGEKIGTTKQDIARAIQKHAPPEFVKMAKEFGVQSWPPLVRLLQSIGASLRPDSGKIEGGGAGSVKEETLEEMQARWYGTAK